MRLFPLVDGRLDHRDRGLLLMPPFDLDLSRPGAQPPYAIAAAAIYQPGAVAAGLHLAGPAAAAVFLPGAQAGAIHQ